MCGDGRKGRALHVPGIFDVTGHHYSLQYRSVADQCQNVIIITHNIMISAFERKDTTF